MNMQILTTDYTQRAISKLTLLLATGNGLSLLACITYATSCKQVFSEVMWLQYCASASDEGRLLLTDGYVVSHCSLLYMCLLIASIVLACANCFEKSLYIYSVRKLYVLAESVEMEINMSQLLGINY